MKRRSKSLSSKFEQTFQAERTFKRNKRYIDLEKMQNIQHEFQARRRKPLKNEDENVLTKIHSSFMNSTAELTQRIQKNINKYKNRMSFSQSHIVIPDEEDLTENQKTKKVKSFSMQKMTSRDYHHNIKNKPVLDERLFNNYQQQKPDRAHTSDFSKRKGKKLDNRIKHMNDIYHQTQKLYQEYYYKKSSSYTKVNYKAEKKLKSDRVFYIDKRPQNKPATDLQPQKIDSGLKIASNFKGSNIKSSNTEGFYRNCGRQLPCQFDMRNMTQLTNHWKGQNGKIERPVEEFGAKMMKDDLIEERKQRLKRSKKANINRSEVCDYVFFKYHKNN